MEDAVLNKIKSDQDTLKSWMENLHETPELAMHKTHTSKFISEKLREIGGWRFVEGVGKTGIVASMTVGDSSKSIGLRADFDALPIQEDNDLPYKAKRRVGHPRWRERHARVRFCKIIKFTAFFVCTSRMLAPAKECNCSLFYFLKRLHACNNPKIYFFEE